MALPAPEADPTAETLSSAPPPLLKDAAPARARFIPRLEGDDIPTEEWMLSYSDMVTLLLSMFVALLLNARFDLPVTERAGYGAGTPPAVDANMPSGDARGAGAEGGPGKVGSDSGRGGAGRGGFFESLFQLRVETPYEGEQAIGLTIPALPAPLYTQPDSALAVVKDADLERIRRREAVLASVRRGLEKAGLTDFITATPEGDAVRLNIPNSILFEAGAADLQGRGPAVIKALSPILIAGDFTVAVEGHTDNQPISTPRYPSNWELSASRAAAVVRVLVAEGAKASRLEAIGFADSRPLADNAVEDGRKENRRVTLLLRAP